MRILVIFQVYLATGRGLTPSSDSHPLDRIPIRSRLNGR
jgi:hypothetical protein